MKETKYDATYKLGNTTVNIVAPKNQTKEQIDKVLEEYYSAGRAIVKEMQEREYAKYLNSKK
ncbi:cell division protein FtsZ [Fictibacillus nanhaiensis]|uniref:cell division protein FtsZ n=1 Tax=Fictibacillus nanhaiensis TaxID=742169 RepID=UPI002E2159DD|nr:cell division protein FtsZ [Fictibacillus nanhaiensis]